MEQIIFADRIDLRNILIDAACANLVINAKPECPMRRGFASGLMLSAASEKISMRLTGLNERLVLATPQGTNERKYPIIGNPSSVLDDR